MKESAFNFNKKVKGTFRIISHWVGPDKVWFRREGLDKKKSFFLAIDNF